MSSKEEGRKWREPGKGLTGRIGYALGSVKVLVERRRGPADPAGQARQGAHHARPLGPQPGRGHDLAGRPLSRTSRRSSTSSARSPSGRSTSAPTPSRTPSPTPGSRRATASGSCAATTAASSRRRWRVSKLGADALYLNTAFAGPQLTEVVKREKPIAIVYDEEFTELLEEAGKRRKRFVAWHDSEQHGRPHPRRADRGGRPRRRGAAVARGPRGDPHLGHHRHAQGRLARQPGDARPGRVAALDRIPLHTRQTVHIAAPLFHSWGFAHFTLGLMLGSTYVLRRKFDPEAVPGRDRAHARRGRWRWCR